MQTTMRIARRREALLRLLPRALPPPWEVTTTVRYDTIRYDTRRYFNVRSKADMSQLNLPQG